MAHNSDATPPREGEARTGLAGLREVDSAAGGHAQRIRDIAFQIALEKVGGRIVIKRSEIMAADLNRNIVIRGDVDEKSGDPTVVIELR